MGPRKRETKYRESSPPDPAIARQLPYRPGTTPLFILLKYNGTYCLPVVTETFVVPNSRVPAHVVDVRGSRSPRGSRTYSTEEPRRVSYFIYFMYPRKRSLLRVEIIKARVWLREIVVFHTEALRLGRNKFKAFK